jgi:hypothetical protein
MRNVTAFVIVYRYFNDNITQLLICDLTILCVVTSIGACHEWLKKFAEVNPSFSVITFTDANLNGVYVEQIEC